MHEKLLIVLTFLWSIVPSFTTIKYGYSDFEWLVVLYFFAGYIKKYVNIKIGNSCKHFAIAIISYSLIVISDFFFLYLGHITNINIFIAKAEHFNIQNSPFVLLTSIELMIAFLKIKPNHNQTINLLASAAFGVYLIHENVMLRPYLWIKVLRNQEFYFSKYLILHAILSITTVYCVCSLIDIIRQYTLEKAFLQIVDKHLKTTEKKVYNVIESIQSKFSFLIDYYYTDRSGTNV